MTRSRERQLGVIIPCYNEASTIREILERISRQRIVREIVVVDDVSTDGSRRVLDELRTDRSPDLPPLAVVLQGENRGKGAAVRAGIPGISSPLVVIQDADLEYDPADYDRLCGPILDGSADVVYGSRFLGGTRRFPPGLHTVANRVLTACSNLCTGLELTDMETCYKVFRTDLLAALPIRSNRFEFEPEITAKLARLGSRIIEVPISYRRRGYADGKKIGWRDGVQALWTILKYRVTSDLEGLAHDLRPLGSTSGLNR